MAEYDAEGLLERLLGLGTNGSVDGTTCNVLEMYTFYIVPNMNPDGAVRGHLRTNAWLWWCQSQSARMGIHWYYMHEELPYNFIGRGKAEGCPNWSSRLEALQGAFLAACCRANSDMQPIFGYDPEAHTGTSKDDSIATCSNQIATRFDLSRSDVGTSNP